MVRLPQQGGAGDDRRGRGVEFHHQGRRMLIEAGRFQVRLAETEEEVAAAQRLRYRVFVEEMGAVATPEEAELRRE
ncbi:MAG: putative hemolysin, partial [Paracoccaceae bacterium]